MNLSFAPVQKPSIAEQVYTCAACLHLSDFVINKETTNSKHWFATSLLLGGKVPESEAWSVETTVRLAEITAQSWCGMTAYALLKTTIKQQPKVGMACGVCGDDDQTCWNNSPKLVWHVECVETTVKLAEITAQSWYGMCRSVETTVTLAEIIALSWCGMWSVETMVKLAEITA